jgi:hypothetical protein
MEVSVPRVDNRFLAASADILDRSGFKAAAQSRMGVASYTGAPVSARVKQALVWPLGQCRVNRSLVSVPLLQGKVSLSVNDISCTTLVVVMRAIACISFEGVCWFHFQKPGAMGISFHFFSFLFQFDFCEWWIALPDRARVAEISAWTGHIDSSLTVHCFALYCLDFFSAIYHLSSSVAFYFFSSSIFLDFYSPCPYLVHTTRPLWKFTCLSILAIICLHYCLYPYSAMLCSQFVIPVLFMTSLVLYYPICPMEKSFYTFYTYILLLSFL